jgi:hypothetical protein
LLTKAAEPATSKPKTTVNTRNFIIVQIESRWTLDLNLQIVGGRNANVRGHQYGVPVAIVGRGSEGRLVERQLQSGDHGDTVGSGNRHEASGCEGLEPA